MGEIMEFFTIILVIVGVVCGIKKIYRQNKIEREMLQSEEKENDMNATDVENNEVKKAPIKWNTKELVIETLREMGCYFEKADGEENAIIFEYQGGMFVVSLKDELPHIGIDFRFWYDFSMYDVEKMALMQKVINNVNSFLFCSVLYTVDKEKETVNLHSRVQILFIPQIPKINKYLSAILRDLFRSRNLVCSELDKITDDGDNQ